jgi:hypothetical protein
MRSKVMSFAKKGILVMVLAANLIGCSKTVAVENYSTTVVATFGGEPIYLNEPMLILRETQLYYEMQVSLIMNVDITNMWNLEKAMIADIKEFSMASILQTKILIANAETLGVALTEIEVEQVKNAIEDFKDNLAEELYEAIGFTDEALEKYYMENALANKVYLEIVKDVDKNLTEEEIRQADFKTIKVPTDIGRENADTLFERVKSGEEMEDVAAEFDLVVEDLTFGSEMTEDIWNVAGALEIGEFGFVENEEYYYILNCMETNNEAAKESRRATIIEERETELFKVEYAQLREAAPEFVLDKKIWNGVNFNKNLYNPVVAEETISETSSEDNVPETSEEESVSETSITDN